MLIQGQRDIGICGQKDNAMITQKDLNALNKFLAKYPTWWYKIGVCDYSRDFDCAPQAHSPEAKYIKVGNIWDNGFSCDHKGSIADAIYDVMEQIEEEVKCYC